MTATTAPPVTGDPLEYRIFQRIRQLQSQSDTGNVPKRDSQLENDIYVFLYRELRGVAVMLPGMGYQANNPNVDVSCRFTSALNKAFARILEKCPDKLLRVKTRNELTGFVSRIMSRMMLNHYKRKGTFHKIVEFLGMTEQEDAQVRDILSQLAEERADYFEQRTGVSFARGLEIITSWDNPSDPELRNRAEALRLRYLDGLSYDDIGCEMGIDKQAVENLLERAKYHLRKLQR